MCYSCEVTFNSMGQLVGWGDMACLDHPEERHLQVNPNDVGMAAARPNGFKIDFVRNTISKSAA